MKQPPNPREKFSDTKRTEGSGKKRTQTKGSPRRSVRAKAGWSIERRRAQAQRIRETKIWLKSTGPRTDEGKKTSSQNAKNPHAWSHKKNRFLAFLKDQKLYLQLYRAHAKKRVPQIASKATFLAVSEVQKTHEKMGFSLGIFGRKLVQSGIEILRENNG